MQAALPNHRRKRTQLDRKYTTHVVQQHPKFQTEKDTTRFSHQPGHDTRLHIYRDSLEVNADGHTQAMQGYGSMDLWQVRYIHFYLYAGCTFYITKVMEIYKFNESWAWNISIRMCKIAIIILRYNRFTYERHTNHQLNPAMALYVHNTIASHHKYDMTSKSSMFTHQQDNQILDPVIKSNC